MDKLVAVLTYIMVGTFLIIFWPLAVALGIVLIWIAVAAAVYRDPALQHEDDDI